MRFETFDAYRKRFPEGADWVENNRIKNKFARDMYHLITEREDLSPRQRKAIKRATEEDAKGSEVPELSDRLTDLVVRVHRAYTDEDREELRFEFRHDDGWVGRFSNDDVVSGRLVLREISKKHGFNLESYDKDEPGSRTFSIIIKRCQVAWVGGTSGDYVILDGIEKPRLVLPVSPPKPPPPLFGGPVDRDDDLPAPFHLSEREEAAAAREREEDAMPAREFAGTTDRGAPVPDTVDWKDALRRG